MIPSGKVLKDQASKAWLPGFRPLPLPLISSVTLAKFLNLCPGFLLCEMEGLRAPMSLRLLWGLNMSTCKRGRREMLGTWSVLCACWEYELVKLPGGQWKVLLVG